MQGPLSEEEINALLSSEVFGHLGCCEGGKPYVVPMAFAFHNNAIYGQTTEGKKVDMLRRNPLVCFQVEKLADGRWSSVVCHGTFQELDFEDLQKPDAITIVKLLTERIGSIQANVGVAVPFSFEDGAAPLTVNQKKSTLYRIVISEKTGRFYTTQK